MKGKRIRLTEDVRSVLDKYLDALYSEKDPWNYEQPFGQVISSRVFLTGHRPSPGVFAYLLSRTLTNTVSLSSSSWDNRAKYATTRALAHPLCPPELLELALTSSVAEYRRIALRHPNTPEAAAVAVELLEGGTQ